jgi:hypothetical protein
MNNQTLGDHARAWYSEQFGFEMPDTKTPEGLEAYQLWVMWAFNDMRGIINKNIVENSATFAKDKAYKEALIWVNSHRK